MRKSIIRSDKWPLQPSSYQRQLMRLTVHEYRAFCYALSFIVLNNWPNLSKAVSFTAAVERLIHPTAKNPHPRHTYFARRFYKFPSYLRRAAIEFVKGQVSSYLSRYDSWLDGNRKNSHDKPPLFNPNAGCYPVLYRGHLVKFDENYTVASLKLWDGKEWLWHDTPIKSTGKRHQYGTIKSPSLIINRRCHLSVPIQIKPKKLPSSNRVCAVDVGINTLAVASIVMQDGTVAARGFMHPAADIDRRNKRTAKIHKKARKTAKPAKGFCKHLYRKVRNINEHIAQIVSRQLVDFALAHNADVIVLENLKGWRPTAGRKRSPLRQRFHGWLHRRLAHLVQEKFEEVGGRVVYVYARDTSSWAFDGSGLLRRDTHQYDKATFSTGKQYNADLNASYNIGACYWAMKLKLTHRKDGQLSGDGSSTDKPRIPVTLSTLWHHARAA